MYKTKVCVADFFASSRKQLGITQEEFAEKAGVALRKFEQGKENLSLSKVNHINFC